MSLPAPNAKFGDDVLYESVIRMIAFDRQFVYGSSHREGCPPTAQKPSMPAAGTGQLAGLNEHEVLPPMKYFWVSVRSFVIGAWDPEALRGKMIGTISPEGLS